jgi:rfaE bifunctional protein nucleotidyltransferase chain/domain
MYKNVIVNGTFDIIHFGHLCLLNFACQLGTNLIVAIDSDRRIKNLKGDGRPINSEIERQFLLENLKSVDKVEIFDTDEELIDLIKNCDIMVKGSDYIDQPIIGKNLLPIIFFQRINEYSTTNKIKSVIDRG